MVHFIRIGMTIWKCIGWKQKKQQIIYIKHLIVPNNDRLEYNESLAALSIHIWHTIWPSSIDRPHQSQACRMYTPTKSSRFLVLVSPQNRWPSVHHFQKLSLNGRSDQCSIWCWKWKYLCAYDKSIRSGSRWLSHSIQVHILDANNQNNGCECCSRPSHSLCFPPLWHCWIPWRKYRWPPHFRDRISGHRDILCHRSGTRFPCAWLLRSCLRVGE